MKIIWKFNVEINDFFEIEIPKDAKVLTVQTQRNEPRLWAIVNPFHKKEIRKFIMV